MVIYTHILLNDKKTKQYIIYITSFVSVQPLEIKFRFFQNIYYENHMFVSYE